MKRIKLENQVSAKTYTAKEAYTKAQYYKKIFPGVKVVVVNV